MLFYANVSYCLSTISSLDVRIFKNYFISRHRYQFKFTCIKNLRLSISHIRLRNYEIVYWWNILRWEKLMTSKRKDMCVVVITQWCCNAFAIHYVIWHCQSVFKWHQMLTDYMRKTNFLQKNIAAQPTSYAKLAFLFHILLHINSFAFEQLSECFSPERQTKWAFKNIFL